MDPKWRNLIVVVVVVALVVAGVGLYYVRLQAASTTCNTALTSKNPIVIDQAETVPDNLDPDSTFSTPGWAAVQQVYQGLVNYNGTSYTNFSGVLAKNWSVSPDGLNYTFNLRSGVHFSNGDPYNAYVQWYSFYRSLLLEQGPQFILEQNFYSTNFTPSNPLTYYSNVTAIAAANATLITDLNTWNFTSPTVGERAQMALGNQSFQALNATTIRLHLGYGYLATPYTYLLASISAPNSFAVDPIVVNAHGGVVEGDISADWLTTNTVGTGPYLLSNYNDVAGGGYSLTPDVSYWGAAAAAAEPWNPMIQPANSSVNIVFQESSAVTTTDLSTGAVADASFAYLGPSAIQALKGNPCLVVQDLPIVYGATAGSWWIYMNQSVAPFNNLSVREAIAHAINYQQIIQEAFGGYAQTWVGPVPPSYPYYNPAHLSPYTYNLTLAQQEIANSPCASGCSGIKYAYINLGDWAEVTTLLQIDLQAIGINIVPVPIQLPQLYSLQALTTGGVCTTSTTAYGGPFSMGQEFYTSDYISPDDWTQNDAYGGGSANACMSGYHNGTMDTLVYQAAADSNATNLTTDYTTMTQLMYDNYTNIWLVVPDSVAIYSIHLHGVVQNPMGSAEPFTILFNTQSAS